MASLVSKMRGLLENRGLNPDAPKEGVQEKAPLYVCHTDNVDGYMYSSDTGPYTENGNLMIGDNIFIHNWEAPTPLYEIIEIYDKYF